MLCIEGLGLRLSNLASQIFIDRLSGLAKMHGVQIKASGAMLRLRLYQSLALLPPSTYEGLFCCACLYDYVL